MYNWTPCTHHSASERSRQGQSCLIYSAYPLWGILKQIPSILSHRSNYLLQSITQNSIIIGFFTSMSNKTFNTKLATQTFLAQTGFSFRICIKHIWCHWSICLLKLLPSKTVHIRVSPKHSPTFYVKAECHLTRRASVPIRATILE